ncbi:hypothetical protein QBC35DRAFT_383892 [Podospora australis]|uniref:Rhodopsin domain-containing protein n=1 Tax=Podospora australis TaxID=1536484 RepID=A0AAN7AGL7_9PEZI|nr:hypothetical protein QBC35DRAFT_383892 [Podospora australis]
MNRTTEDIEKFRLRAQESNSALFMTIICVVWSFAFCTALVRFYTRAIVVRSFGKDDIFMVLAVLCGIGGLVSWIIGCQNGYGQHQDTIPPPKFLVLLEAQFFQSVIEASFAFGFLKISIALSLLRLHRGKIYKWILWSLIGFTCFYTIFAFITFMTRCEPISGQWNPAIRPRCYSRFIYRNFGLFNAACNIFTDIAFATLPIPLIWSLQLQRRTRIYLIAILSGGYFAVGLGIAKAMFIIAFVHNNDGTFYPWAPFFGALQLDIGIIAACAPTLRPLLGRALKLHNAVNYHQDANYYRAGKALDRLPGHIPGHHNGSGRARYLRHDSESAQFVELIKGDKQWASLHGLDSSFSATAVHAEHVPQNGETLGDRSGSDEDIILPITIDPEFKGIVKTTEFRIEQ